MTKRPSSIVTVEQRIQAGARQLKKGLWFGHGSDNALDEAAELVFFAADLRHDEAAQAYARALTPAELERIDALFERRIRERVPAAYLTHRMWFAGHEFYVDERVLVPRSPIAELIEARLEPWIDATRIRRILDIGTGSGCIAIATALALPEAQVDAADISPDALTVARINVDRYGLAHRVRTVESDVYSGLGDHRYDLILTNPPYVGRKELDALPEEYHREPQLGLYGGEDGLDIVRRILSGAAAHLTEGGVLIGEVGNTDEALQAAFPDVPFVWLEFERGGGGVFVLGADELQALATGGSG